MYGKLIITSGNRELTINISLFVTAKKWLYLTFYNAGLLRISHEMTHQSLINGGVAYFL